MATRSTIALEFADGTVQQIYCHWDGYLDNNGRILFEHYKDPFKVRELIDHGSVSSLGAEIGSKRPFDNPHKYGSPEYQAFNAQYDQQCLFYARDRGEDLEVSRFKDYADYRKNAQFEEYNYILRRDGNWYVEFYGDFDGLLSEAFEYEANQREDA